ncbi:MAG TPA: dihydroorotate dehydrogenase [Clostridiales bacterium]|nr:dihydroorotate dehydrogenase [Clostridiales bacterium]
MQTNEVNLSVDLKCFKMKNPVVAASGTYGFGREYAEYVDLNAWGGISVKGLTLEERAGNPPPRTVETPSGMLNSVGLQNPGIQAFLQNELPFLRQFDTVIIANVAGNTVEEYVEMARILNKTDIDVIELNMSCPNVKKGCMAFGSTPDGISQVVNAVRHTTDKPVMVKLTPNVTDIAELALAAQKAGADALSLINTLLGMVIDVNTRRPVLANNTGGLSGPAIRPVAVRMVYQVAQAVDIPVIGMGGITSGRDVIEFILAGASSVMVGTWNFTDPMCIEKILDYIKQYMIRHNVSDLKELIGKVEIY